MRTKHINVELFQASKSLDFHGLVDSAQNALVTLVPTYYVYTAKFPVTSASPIAFPRAATTFTNRLVSPCNKRLDRANEALPGNCFHYQHHHFLLPPVPNGEWRLQTPPEKPFPPAGKTGGGEGGRRTLFSPLSILSSFGEARLEAPSSGERGHYNLGASLGGATLSYHAKWENCIFASRRKPTLSRSAPKLNFFETNKHKRDLA